MSLPPLSPMRNTDGKPISYFEKLMRYALDYLKEDGIKLTFEGYTDTIKDYASLQEDEIDKAWRLAKELNAWTEYFSSISNLIQKLYLDSETSKKEVQATVSLNADSVKVANGDRLSNKDPNVVMARRKRNALKAVHDELEAKISFLERAYYHCKSTCDWANKSMNASNNVPRN